MSVTFLWDTVEMAMPIVSLLMHSHGLNSIITDSKNVINIILI